MSAYDDAVLADIPVVYWKLDDPNPVAAIIDSSGNGNNAPIRSGNNTPAAALFPGSSAAVATFNATGAELPGVGGTGVPSWTIEVWVSTLAAAPVFFYTDGSIATLIALTIRAPGTGGLIVDIRSSDTVTVNEQIITSGVDLTDGTPHHYVVTCGPTEAIVYTDGVSVGSVSYSSASFTLDDLLALGTYSDPATFDAFAVYPAVLSPAQVAAHYAAAGIPVTALVGTALWWEPFGDGFGGFGWSSGTSGWTDFTTTFAGHVMTAEVTADVGTYKYWQPVVDVDAFVEDSYFAFRAYMDATTGNKLQVIYYFDTISPDFTVTLTHDTVFWTGGSTATDAGKTYYRVRRTGGDLIFERSADGATGWESLYTGAVADAGGIPFYFELSNTVGSPTGTAGKQIHIGSILYASTTAGSYDTMILADGPAMYLGLDESYRTPYIYDYTGNSNDVLNYIAATAPADTSRVAGLVTGSISARQVAPSSPGATSVLTTETAAADIVTSVACSVEMWFAADSAVGTSGNIQLAGGSNQAVIQFNALGYTVAAYIFDGTNFGLVGTAAAQGTGAHQYVLTSDATNARLYIDGVLVDTAAHGITTFTANVILGFADTDVSTFDAVAVYDYTLTPEQVAAHYGGESPAVTLTYNDDLSRVQIEVSGLTGTAADVDRRCGDTGTWVRVRGGTGVPVSGGGFELPVDDYEFCTDLPSGEQCPPGATTVASTYRICDYAAPAALALTGAVDSYASTPDAAALDIVADIDLAMGVVSDDWTPSTDRVLAAKQVPAGNQRSWMFSLLTTGRLRLTWFEDGTTATTMTATSTASVPIIDVPTYIRVTLDVDDGGGNHVARFFRSDAIGGTWTPVGAAVTVAGTTSVFASTANLEIGSYNSGAAPAGMDRFIGYVYALELRDGIDGTVVADPFFSQPLGTTSFADAAGRTWTVHAAAEIVADPYVSDATPIVYLGCQTATISPDFHDVWLKSISRPFLNRAVVVLDAFGEVTRPFRGGVFDVVGRSLPVAVSDVRGSRRWTLEICAATAADHWAIDYLLASGDPLLLQVPVDSNLPVPTMYTVVGDVAASKVAFSDARGWSLPLTEVAAPGADVIGHTITWSGVLAAYATWADVLAGAATWLDLLQQISDPSEVIVP